MRIKRKDEIGDIGTAVFYKFKKFIPDPDYKVDPNLFPEEDRDRRVKELTDILDSRQQVGEGGKNETFLTHLNSTIFNNNPRVLYLGSQKKFTGIDLAEYDFNAILEEQKFNNRDLISYLDRESQDKIGNGIGGINKINSALLPTISTSTASSYEFFGSLNLSAATIYLFNLEPEVYKIELYEGHVTRNAGTGFYEYDGLKVLEKAGKLGPQYKIVNEPAITIYLGPNQECINNPETTRGSLRPLYIINDLLNPKSTRVNSSYSYDDLEYSKLYDEIYSGKSVWLVLSSDNTIREVNLSYNAWLRSDDANIFKNKFNLRNDEYHKVSKNISVKNEGDDYSDLRSGKLLGNKSLKSTPLLSRKFKNIERSKGLGETYIDQDGYLHLAASLVDGDGYVRFKQTLNTSGDGVMNTTSLLNGGVSGAEQYNPEIEYKVGDTVYHLGSLYKALRSGNRGHFPDISSYWALKDKVDDYSTTRITILSNPVGSGTVSPNRQITKDVDNLSSTNFNVIANPGYKLGSVSLEKNSGEREDLSLSEDYIITDIVDGDDYFDVVTVQSEGWNKVIVDDSRKRLIFNFIKAPTKFSGAYDLSDDPENPTYNALRIKGISDPAEKSPVITDRTFGMYLFEVDVIDEEGNRTTYNTVESIEAYLVGYINSEGKKVESLMRVGDRVTFCISFLDYSGNAASKITDIKSTVGIHGKLSEGELDIERFDIPESEMMWEKCHCADIVKLTTTINSDSLNLLVTGTTKLTVTVVDFSGFEVSPIKSKVDLNSSLKVQFYGTYYDRFDHVEIRNGSGDEYIEVYFNDIAGPGISDAIETLENGYKFTVARDIISCLSHVALQKEKQLYTLTLYGVTEDINIKLVEK